jgi:fucose permease
MIIAGFTSSFLEITYNIIVSNNNKKSIILFNALHIFHGLGAMIGPIISNQIIKYHWYYIYLVEFCITFLLFIYLLIIYINTSNENLNNFSKEEVETKKNNEGDVSLIKMFKKPIIIFIPLFLMFYLGLDLSLGNWFYTYLIEYIKGEKTDMSFVISIFWVNQLISEIILIVISYFSKLKNLNIISISIFIIISWICLIFIHYNKDTTMVSILFCIIGFCLGPIHPTVLSIVNDKFNKNQSLLIKSITICSTIPYLGLSIFPFICGMIIDNYGIKRLIILCITFLFVMSICFLAFMVCLFHERIQKYIKSPSFKNIK